MAARHLLYALLFILLGVALVSGTAAQTPAPESTAEPQECDAGATREGNIGFFIGQGDSYFSQKNYTRAAESYTCAVLLNPNYLPAYVNRGIAYAVQRNDDLALADFNYALEINSDAVSAYNNRGILYLSLGRFEQSINDFSQVIALAPENPVAYQNRAVVHAAEGNYDLALADLDMALQLDPNDADAYATQGAVYMAMSMQSYATHRELSESPVTPRGAHHPNDMLRNLQAAREIDSFTVWLPLLTTIREATP
jgi:tetratricopeptide (TPR) repeat protein